MKPSQTPERTPILPIRFASEKAVATTSGAVRSATTISSAQALTVYTAGPGSLAKSLASGYEKKTGVKVNIFQATTGKVMARLEAEQANPQADVLISASWDTAEDLHHRGWLLPYQSANADKVPANLKSADYVAQGISALGIVWNTKSGTPEPKEWRDLTEAAFKDKVTTPDPALSGASLDLLIGLQNGMGDKAWALFDTLKKNGMVVSGPNAQAVTPVMQGAMENAGCVTHRDDYIFRSRPVEARVERRAVTILHELAHMWFGDLVTMKW